MEQVQLAKGESINRKQLIQKRQQDELEAVLKSKQSVI
jgi:hypothetical protein